MRHLRSILYCLVLAPAVWILCGVGFDQDLTGRARDDGGIESLTGVLLLLLAGAAYAILLFSPISPLGPLLSGLGFAGVGAWARLAPDSYAGVWPANVTKDGFDLSRPGYGLAVLLAMPLLATALSARRWRAFEPPEILLIGTIGRAHGAARVAGTSMASEQTTVIPQQRHSPEFVPGFGASSADSTQLLPPPHQDDDRTIAVPLGRPPSAFSYQGDADEKTTALPLGRPPAAHTHNEDADEKTTALALGRPPAMFSHDADDREEETTALALGQPPATGPADDEPTRFVVPAVRQAPDDLETEDIAAGGHPTEPISDTDETTSDVTAPHSPAGSPPPTSTAAAAPTAAADETTRNVVADDATRSGAAARMTPGADDAAEEATARLVLPVAANPQAAQADADKDGDGDDKTQLLTLPTASAPATGADAGADADERTQAIRMGTVEPPGDRTQLLTFPAPGEATTVTIAAAPAETPSEADTRQESPESTKAMSIAAAERPDPGEDPTTRLTPPGEKPGETPTEKPGETPVEKPGETPGGKPAEKSGGKPAESRGGRPGEQLSEATTRPGAGRGATTVTSIERPADEAADDTRPLALPAPRPPTEDETTRLR